jgi:CheY-like chemotaxis protein
MGRTVLVVDDDVNIQATLRDLLQDEGYQVLTANDGLEALERLNSALPALILLDLMMPRMDGYAFVEELSRRGLRAAVPIIVLTADGRARQKATQMGADGFAEKPFSLLPLLEQVERLTQA